MKYLIASAFIVAACGGILAQSVKSSVADARWLAGCWELTDATRGIVITEMWMKPNGGSMLGIGRTVRKGVAADFEFLRIEEKGNSLSYISKPRQNDQEIEFKLIKSAAKEFVFENAAHDFPQRIIYKQSGNESLWARIEGTSDGKTRGIDFRYTRAKCE